MPQAREPGTELLASCYGRGLQRTSPQGKVSNLKNSHYHGENVRPVSDWRVSPEFRDWQSVGHVSFEPATRRRTFAVAVSDQLLGDGSPQLQSLFGKSIAVLRASFRGNSGVSRSGSSYWTAAMPH